MEPTAIQARTVQERGRWGTRDVVQVALHHELPEELPCEPGYAAYQSTLKERKVEHGHQESCCGLEREKGRYS